MELTKYLFEFSAYDLKPEAERKESDDKFSWSNRERDVTVQVAAEDETLATSHVKKLVNREFYDLESICQLDEDGRKIGSW